MASNPLTKIHKIKERIAHDGKMISHLDGKEHTLFPTAIPLEEFDDLRNWIVKEKATHTIEIGLAYGMSALAICEGLAIQSSHEKKHVILDPFQLGFSNCGIQLLTEAEVIDFVEFHLEKSEIILPQFLSQNREFDFAFVDGNHKFDSVFVDLFYLGQLVRPGKIIFLDDYQLDGIARAASFFIKNLDWKIEYISEPDEYHQWAILRTAETIKTRKYDFFVDF